MRISAKELRKIIREQLMLSERMRPGIEVDPETMTFQGMADPTRPEEGEEPEMVRGRIKLHKGKYLPGADPEDLPFGYESARSVSGQLSAQVGDELRSLLTDLGYPSSEIADTIARTTKGELLSSQLEIILQLGNKLRGKADQQSIKDAVDAILDIKVDFDIPDPREESLMEALGAGGAGAAAADAPAAADADAASKKQTDSGDKKRIMAVQKKVGVAVDGKMGPKTKAALRDWQKKNGLTADGVIGKKTLAKMGIAEGVDYMFESHMRRILSEEKNRY